MAVVSKKVSKLMREHAELIELAQGKAREIQRIYDYFDPVFQVSIGEGPDEYEEVPVEHVRDCLEMFNHLGTPIVGFFEMSEHLKEREAESLDQRGKKHVPLPKTLAEMGYDSVKYNPNTSMYEKVK